MNSFRQNSQSALIIHALERPTSASLGVLDSQTETGQSGLVRQINRELRRIASAQRGVYILDYDSLVARYGSEHWHDERKWQMARLPIAADHLLHMAREWMRFLVPLTGRTAKCLAVDLDNTLWGGIIGEDGMAGIKVSAEYPGAVVSSVASRVARFITQRNSAGRLQQKQSRRRHRSARKAPWNAVSRQRFRGHAHQLGRQDAKSPRDRRGTKHRHRLTGFPRRQPLRARAGPRRAPGNYRYRHLRQSAGIRRCRSGLPGLRAPHAFRGGSAAHDHVRRADASARAPNKVSRRKKISFASSSRKPTSNPSPS